MKKYVVLSTLIHSAFLIPLLWVGESRFVPKESTSTLHFEILAFQEGDELQIQKQKASPLKPAPKLKKKVLTKKATDPTPQPKTKRQVAERSASPSIQEDNPSSHDDPNSSPKTHNHGSALEARKQKLDYAQQLKFFIEQNKFYPRSARKLKQAGLVRLQVEIDKNGNFRNIKIIEASHHENLNQAALSLIKKLGHFKPLPKEFSKDTDFTIPIAYQLSSGIK